MSFANYRGRDSFAVPKPAPDADLRPPHDPGWSLLEVPKIADLRGNLTFIEGNRHIPFDIARVYYIYDVPSGSARAGHAHRRLRQLFMALSGSFAIHLDDGIAKQTIFLNRPNTALYVPPGVWRVIDDFSGGAVMLVLASEPYDESDYIRSYDDFTQYTNSR